MRWEGKELFALAIICLTFPLLLIGVGLDRSDWLKTLDTHATLIGDALALFLLLATGLYVYYTRQQIEAVRENHKRDNEQQSAKIKGDTLIDLTRTWHSKDYISARNGTAQILEQKRLSQPEKIYAEMNEMIGPGGYSRWVDASMIAHFLYRVSRLYEQHQIEPVSTRAEFAEAVAYWVPRIVPLYRTFPAEVRLVESLSGFFHILHRGTPLPDHFFDSKQV